LVIFCFSWRNALLALTRWHNLVLYKTSALLKITIKNFKTWKTAKYLFLLDTGLLHLKQNTIQIDNKDLLTVDVLQSKALKLFIKVPTDQQ